MSWNTLVQAGNITCAQVGAVQMGQAEAPTPREVSAEGVDIGGVWDKACWSFFFSYQRSK